MPIVRSATRPFDVDPAGHAQTPMPAYQPGAGARALRGALRREMVGGNLPDLLRVRVAQLDAELMGEAGFDPYESGFFEQNPHMIDHQQALFDVQSERHADAISAKVRRELEDEKAIRDGGVPGMLFAFGAGVLSPENAIPIGVVLARARGFASTVRRAGLAGGLGATAGELPLQATQETRTALESGANVAGSVILGGFLGGAVGALNKTGRALISRQLDLAGKEMKSDLANFTESGKAYVTELDVRGRARAAERRLRGLVTEERVTAASARVREARAHAESLAQTARARVTDGIAQAKKAAVEGREAARAAAEERTQIEPETATTRTRAEPPEPATRDLIAQEADEASIEGIAPERPTSAELAERPASEIIEQLETEAPIAPRQRILNEILKGNAEVMEAAGLTAKQIQGIQARLAQGPIDSVDDLLDVKGIGPKTLEKLDTFAARPLKDVPDEVLLGDPEGLTPLTEQLPLDGDAFQLEVGLRQTEAAERVTQAIDESIEAQSAHIEQLDTEAKKTETKLKRARKKKEKAEEVAAQERGKGEAEAEPAEEALFNAEDEVLSYEQEMEVIRRERNRFKLTRGLGMSMRRKIVMEPGPTSPASTGPPLLPDLRAAQRAPTKVSAVERPVGARAPMERPRAPGDPLPVTVSRPLVGDADEMKRLKRLGITEFQSEFPAIRTLRQEQAHQVQRAATEQAAREATSRQMEPTSGQDRLGTLDEQRADLVFRGEDPARTIGRQRFEEAMQRDMELMDYIEDAIETTSDPDQLRELFEARESALSRFTQNESIYAERFADVRRTVEVAKRESRTAIKKRIDARRDYLLQELKNEKARYHKPAGAPETNPLIAKLERELMVLEAHDRPAQGAVVIRGLGVAVGELDDIHLTEAKRVLFEDRALDKLSDLYQRRIGGDPTARAELPADNAMYHRELEIMERLAEVNDEMNVATGQRYHDLNAERDGLLRAQQDPDLGLSEYEVVAYTDMMEQATERFGDVEQGRLRNRKGSLIDRDELTIEELQNISAGLEDVDAEDIAELLDDLDGPVAGGMAVEDVIPTGVSVMRDKITRILGLPDRLVRKLLRFNPILRMSLSDLDSNRMMIQLLTDTGLDWQRFGKGYSSFESVFDRVQRRWGSKEFEILKSIPDFYFEDLAALRGIDPETLKGFITRKSILAGEAAGQKLGITKASVTEWYRGVTRAVRNNGIDVNSKRRVGIEKAAKAVKELFDESLTEMVNLKMLPVDLREQYTGGYMTRVWNINKLMENQEEWMNIVAGKLQIDEGITLDEADGIAARMFDSITAGPTGRLDDVNFMERTTRVTKKRRVPGTDKEWSDEGWLTDDIDVILRYWFRTVPPDLELARLDTMLTPANVQMREGWAPDPSLRRTLRRARLHAEEQIRTETTPDSPERAAMQRQLARAYGTRTKPGDLPAMVQILRRTYGIPKNPNSPLVRGSIAMRNFNYLVDGGTFWLSSLPDVGRPVMVHGVKRVYGTGIKALLKDWSTVKLNAREAQIAGTAADMVTNRRVQELYDLGLGYGRGSRGERILKRFADEYSILNGLSIHNTYIKQWEATIAGQHILDDIELFTSARFADGSPGTSEAMRGAERRLAKLGIDLHVAQRIWGEVKDNPVPNGILREIRSEDWTDTYAQGLFRTALRRTIDSTINTPHPGVRPLIYSREMGKFIMQYKSFGFASAMQTAIPGMQQPSWAWLHGAAIATGFGMISVYLKSQAGGWDVPGPDDISWWIRNGIDASGVAGIFGDVHNTLGYATRGESTIGAALTGQIDPAYRYTSRGPLGSLLGPSVSTLTDIGRVGAGLASVARGEQPPTRAYNAAKRMVPTNNHILVNAGVWQPAFKEAERYVRREFVDQLSTTRGVPRPR